MFEINGEIWRVFLVPPNFFKLRKRGYAIETINMPFVDKYGTKSQYGKYILLNN